eukprot:TRINITY_DN15134_c0_g1_i1.p1 TRINITY_DN15134_c0_g1~~TRINITY_DN15134_c0_g1_i1.p1  ORF type:complete len:308 (-),score=63.66 TRINITY_DN15134_c0_g1_i1:281-1177(-)
MGQAQGSETGFHVLQVQANSPAEQAGLHSFFDFILSANGQRLDAQSTQLAETMLKSKNQQMTLVVYNIKTQTAREVHIIPRDDWGGSGLLGATIRHCEIEAANQHVFHVLEVFPKSPAAVAGLEPDRDYIVGTRDVLFEDEASLGRICRQSIGQTLKMFVYNTLSDTVREVPLTPSDSWGGDGCLGCATGYGFLHRIPIATNSSHRISDLLLQSPPPLVAPESPPPLAIPVSPVPLVAPEFPAPVHQVPVVAPEFPVPVSQLPVVPAAVPLVAPEFPAPVVAAVSPVLESTEQIKPSQ